MRLVEQQQLGVAGQRDREREPAALTLRQAAVRHIRDSVSPTRMSAASAAARSRPAARVAKRQVLGHGEVVIAEGLVADEADLAAQAPAVAGEVVPQHLGRPVSQREQACTQAQQRGLAGAVRPREQHDFARVDLEVGTGECGEPAEQAHCRPQADDARRAAFRNAGAVTAKVYEGGRMASEPPPRVGRPARTGILVRCGVR